MRWLRLTLPLAASSMLLACSPEPQAGGDKAPEAAVASAAPAANGQDMIECAVHGAQWFLRECAVERVEEAGQRYLVVRHPDGGFRRFKVLTDGRGLATADGAQQVRSELVDGRLDVSVGDDRYRFPATVKASDDVQRSE